MKIGYLMQAGAPNVRQQPLSGPANHVVRVFHELANLGHTVHLLAHLDGQLWKSDDLKTYERVTVRGVDQGPARWVERLVRRIQYELKLPYAAFFESLRFALACRQELSDCDLFYERMGWVGYGGALASGLLQIPLVLEVNGDHLTEFEMLGVAPRGAQRWLSFHLMKLATGQASHAVTTGDGWRHQYIERWNVNPASVSTIENGSDVVDLLRREQLRAFAPSENEPDQVTLVYIGAFEPWHGIPILIRAVAKVVAQGAPVRLLLIGSGKEADSIKQLVAELGLDEQVLLTGRLSIKEMARHLANADIGVSPYCGRVEYSGLKLLDYKAAGLATIASGHNGQPALLAHGHTGWIIPPCDEDALAEAIYHLAQGKDLRICIGRAARREAECLHSWRHTAAQLNTLFTRMMVERPQIID